MCTASLIARHFFQSMVIFSSRGGSYLLKYTPLDALCGVCVCEFVCVLCVCVSGVHVSSRH